MGRRSRSKRSSPSPSGGPPPRSGPISPPAWLLLARSSSGSSVTMRWRTASPPVSVHSPTPALLPIRRQNFSTTSFAVTLPESATSSSVRRCGRCCSSVPAPSHRVTQGSVQSSSRDSSSCSAETCFLRSPTGDRLVHREISPRSPISRYRSSARGSFSLMASGCLLVTCLRQKVSSRSNSNRRRG